MLVERVISAGSVAANAVSTTIAVYCRAPPIVTADTVAVATTIMTDLGTALGAVAACLGTLARRGTMSETAANFGIPAVVVITVELRLGGDPIGWQQSNGADRYRKAHGARRQSAKQGLHIAFSRSFRAGLKAGCGERMEPMCRSPIRNPDRNPGEQFGGEVG